MASRQALEQKVRALTAVLRQLQKQVFGRKSEQASVPTVAAVPPVEATPEVAVLQRHRGQRGGVRGHGRRRRVALPVETVDVILPPEARCCPHCGLPYDELGSYEESEEIHREVHLVRRIYRRARYRRTCRCARVPAVVTAPPPPKLIPKGLFSVEFVAWVLIEKFLLARPLGKIVTLLGMEGLAVSPGTLVGVLARVAILLRPLYQDLVAHSQASGRWGADETSWMVFAALEGKANFRWWLWVFVSPDVVIYVLDPSRSGQVAVRHLRPDGSDAVPGWLLTDFFPGYNRLNEVLQRAGCWVHARRPILRAMEGYSELADWGAAWRQRIGRLYHLRDLWVKAPGGTAVRVEAEARLRNHVAELRRVLDEQVHDTNLHPAAAAALGLMDRKWPMLTRFLDDPAIPLDNNESERMLRTPVLGRKNFYGSGAVWSGELAAMVWSLGMTAQKNGLDPLAFLRDYLHACARNGGRSPAGADRQRFHPWAFAGTQAVAVNSS